MAEELPKPMTQAEFDALPTGAQFINPKDGQTYIKSGGQEEDQPSVLESAMDTFTQASDVVEQGATFAISDEVGGAGAATGAALRSIFMDLSEGKAPDFERAAAAGGEAYDRRTGQVRENVEGFTRIILLQQLHCNYLAAWVLLEASKKVYRLCEAQRLRQQGLLAEAQWKVRPTVVFMAREPEKVWKAGLLVRLKVQRLVL